MKLFFQAILIFSVIAFISCKDEPVVPFDNNTFFDCENEMRWDTTVVADALVGQWRWEYIRCFWNPEDANGTQYDDLRISFSQNGSLEAISNLDTTIGTWKVEEIFSDDHRLVVEPYIEQLDGNVYICGNEVMFYNSYIDGCDNFFRKGN